MSWLSQCQDIIESAIYRISTLKPSEWYEQNMIMPMGSAFSGRFRYDKTPYSREIVDCCAKDHPAHTVAVMKGAQIGISAGVLTPMVGYIISEAPGNTLFLTGHSDLSDEAMNKLDQMIDNCGIRDLIRPSTMRKKTQKTGDTNKMKEFAGGSLISGSATNHNLLRQRDIQYAIVDDYDAASKSSKSAGATKNLIEQRTAAYASKRKIFYVSTPELKDTSNIEPAFLAGDQRRYHTPCPCCGEYIVWYWDVEVDGTEGEKGGITWNVNEQGELIEGSVGYICQKCGGFFDDSDKQELLQRGQWIATAKPSEVGYYSYHISALYAPPGMFSWEYYVRQWINANPKDGDPIEKEIQTFKNVVLGETYEPETKQLDATELQKNQRNYPIGVIPEKMSIDDGNGKIVMLTLGADLNGTENDARLDYEIVAWSESGASYSIDHGSIGTFIPREGSKGIDREKWTYRPYVEKSVWPMMDEVLKRVYQTDTGRKMKIFIGAIDAGYMKEYVYPYVLNSNLHIYLVKGDATAKFDRIGRDARFFKLSRENNKMYILESNMIKDDLSAYMSLKWVKGQDVKQPDGFMNFPESSNGKYQYNNFFSHFEAEKRYIEHDASSNIIGSKWKKKDSIVQNHLFDCRCYNIAIRDIMVEKVCHELKIKSYTWQDFVNIVLNRKK